MYKRPCAQKYSGGISYPEVEWMGWYLLVGALAAFGSLCALWALLGWLLPGGRGLTAVCFCGPGLGQLPALRRWCWLRDLGLIRGKLLIVDCGISEKERKILAQMGAGIEIWDPAALPGRLELERERLD